MRILVVNDLVQGGGVEKLMYDIVMRFHTEHEIAILTDKKDQEFEQLYPKDITYYFQMEEDYPKGRNRFERKLIRHQRKAYEEKLIKRIENKKFDVMLCMKEGWIMMLAWHYGASIPRRIAWVHTDYTKHYYTKEFYKTEENELHFMQHFHKVVCVSNVVMESIKTILGDPGNLTVCYNPLNKVEILQKSQEIVEDIERSSSPLFVTVGRLNRQKGYDILLEVCNLLNAENYEYDIWIIGGGENRDQYAVFHDLENKIKEYHLDNVVLLGHKQNPYKYVAQADYFLSTSRYEGYSYVSQEAAILGKPLLLTDCAGVSELISDHTNGIVMENSYKGIYYGMRDSIRKLYDRKQLVDDIKCNEESYYFENRFMQIQQLLQKEIE